MDLTSCLTISGLISTGSIIISFFGLPLFLLLITGLISIGSTCSIITSFFGLPLFLVLIIILSGIFTSSILILSILILLILILSIGDISSISITFGGIFSFNTLFKSNTLANFDLSIVLTLILPILLSFISVGFSSFSNNLNNN